MRVGRTREVRTPPMEELVLHNVINSGVSSRHATCHRAVSHKNVLAILHVNAFIPTTCNVYRVYSKLIFAQGRSFVASSSTNHYNYRISVIGPLRR